MTALAEAMKAAGYPRKQLGKIAEDVLRRYPKNWATTETMGRQVAATPELRKIAVDALTTNASNWDAAKDAVFAAVRNDAGLLWQLFEPYRAIAVQKLLTEVAAEMRKAAAARDAQATAQGGGGHAAGDDQKVYAPPAQPDARSQGRAGEAGPSLKRQPIPQRPASPPSTAGMAAVAATARQSLLDTFRKIADTPIGELTPNQANSWARNNERDTRFVRILTANLPPNEPIGKYRTADEADAAWKQAIEELANAA